MAAGAKLGDAIRVVRDEERGRILTFDSATFVPGHYGDESASKDVVVAASYAGVLCARMIARSRPRGAIGLDCAIGKDGAGVAGLWFYEALDIPAAAADVRTAEMGNGTDLYENGIVSRVNELAEGLGLRPGMTVAAAAALLHELGGRDATDRFADKERREVIHTNADGRSIVCTDSIAFAREEDRRRNVLCTAGHTGRSVVGYIVDSAPWGFICSDGGIGKNDSGITALEPAAEAGIAGASVDALTARMGDGHSTYFDGVISAVNHLAATKGVRVGMPATEAARLLLD
ncbi:hypothetical protein ACSBOB_32240 [Mesorhizobium sp. ASY16-5R]|uniref:hypothetical protein n=1 Tax=Mesorhizobium sp. ASY16-5R TaxID=3445772 RepID=UPI003F9EF4A0